MFINVDRVVFGSLLLSLQLKLMTIKSVLGSASNKKNILVNVTGILTVLSANITMFSKKTLSITPHNISRNATITMCIR